MPMAPVDILKKEFHRSFRGYNDEEVKSYLERISQDYEKLYKENQDLKEEISSLEDKLRQYKESESTLKNTLILAEKAAEDTKKNAQKEKDLILKDALLKASRLVDKAEKKYISLNNQYEELKQQFILFKTRFLNFLQSQIELINTYELNEKYDSDLFSSFEEAAAGSEQKIKHEVESQEPEEKDEGGIENILESSNENEAGEKEGNVLDSQSSISKEGEENA